MKFLAQHDRLIAIVGTAVLTIGFYLGVFRPGQLSARQVQKEITQIEAQLATLPVQVAERVQMQQQLDSRREQAQKLIEQIPTDTDVSAVLHEVSDLARRAGLTITRLEPLPHQDFASYSALPFSLGCKGEFARIAKFLSGMEAQPRLTTFGEISLTRGSDPADKQVQASVSFNVYSRHAKSASITGNTSRPDGASSDN